MCCKTTLHAKHVPTEPYRNVMLRRFVVKTADKEGRKVFINICHSKQVRNRQRQGGCAGHTCQFLQQQQQLHAVASGTACLQDSYTTILHMLWHPTRPQQMQHDFGRTR